jgi:hypothetical protein
MGIDHDHKRSFRVFEALLLRHRMMVAAQPNFVNLGTHLTAVAQEITRIPNMPPFVGLDALIMGRICQLGTLDQSWLCPDSHAE